MKPYTLAQRAAFYAETFPTWPAPRTDERWLDSMWVIGQNFKSGSYYGAYPHSYLQRVMALFPDAERILHLFSGSLPTGNYTRFDRNGNGDVQGEAETLSEHVTQTFDLILADPPYSAEDAEHYGACLVNRNKVVRECIKVLEPGGYLVWLDQVLPMFSKRDLNLVGLIGVVISTNHRFRVVSIFKRTEDLNGGATESADGTAIHGNTTTDSGQAEE